jgi:hypothetical protein
LTFETPKKNGASWAPFILTELLMNYQCAVTETAGAAAAGADSDETDVAAAVVEAAVSTVAVVDDTAVSAAETSEAAAETASTVAAVVEAADSVAVAATLSTPASVSAVGPQPIRSALRRLTTANLFIQITFLLLLLVMPFNLGLTHHILM